MGTYLFGVSLGEHLKPRDFLLWSLLAFLLLPLGYYVYALGKIDPQTGYVLLSSAFLFRLLPLSAALMSTNIVTQEVERHTILYLLTRPIKRSTLILARMAASTVAAFVVCLLGAIFLSLGVYHALYNSLTLNDVLALLAGSVAYTGLFTLLSLLINKSMIVNLLFAFAWETGVPNMPGNLYKATIFSYVQGIAQHPTTPKTIDILQLMAGFAQNNVIAPATSWFVLLGISVVTWALATLRFTTAELVPRENIE